MYETPGQPVIVGYPFLLTLQATTPLFPPGASFVAHVRDPDTDLLITTIPSGQLVRLDSSNLDVSLTAAQTELITSSRVVFDIARTDVTPKTYLGVKITLHVEVPATRGLNA